MKGLLVDGFCIKYLSAITRIPEKTLKQWKSGDARADIPADTKAAQDVRDAIFGDFLGDPKTR